MLFIAGLVGLAILFSFASPAVHRFFEPPATRFQRATSVKRAWAPRPERKRKPAPIRSTLEFWTDLEVAIRRDPSAVSLLPRSEGPRPLQGWNHAWLPADAFSSAWHAQSQGIQRRSPRHALRQARRSPGGNLVSTGSAARKPPRFDHDA